jgi:hypothetical protein
VELPDKVKQEIRRARAVGLQRFNQRGSLMGRPSYWLRLRLAAHGNKWCALHGESTQTGIAGFGNTPAEAFDEFDQRATPALRALAEAIKEERLRRSSPIPHSPAWFLEPDVRRCRGEWWVQYGDNPQDGVAGFGPTLNMAYESFDKTWFTHAGPLGCIGRGTLNGDEFGGL